MDVKAWVPRRKVSIVKPINVLRSKVGYGGLPEDVLEKAQKILDENTVDFVPYALSYLSALERGIEAAKIHSPEQELGSILSQLIYPAIQLRANGAMFRYPLITDMAGKLIMFLERVESFDAATLEIILAFYTSMRAVIQRKVMDDGGDVGRALLAALDTACARYMNNE